MNVLNLSFIIHYFFINHYETVKKCKSASGATASENIMCIASAKQTINSLFHVCSHLWILTRVSMHPPLNDKLNKCESWVVMR